MTDVSSIADRRKNGKNRTSQYKKWSGFASVLPSITVRCQSVGVYKDVHRWHAALRCPGGDGAPASQTLEFIR
jgi:hypothetical protein